MNALLLRTTVSTTLFLTATLALADHTIRRELEDKAFDVLTQARQIRTEIRDHFDSSASYPVLMEEANKLYRSTVRLEDALLCGKAENVICREIDQTLIALRCFRKNVEGCDFACVRGGHHQSAFRGNGYSYRPAIRNPGYVHVLEVRQMVEQLETTLDCLHDDLSQLTHVVPAPVIPRAPLPAPLPAYPHHGHGITNPGNPVGPFLPPPSAGRTRPSYDIPVSLGDRGGFVFRIPIK